MSAVDPNLSPVIVIPASGSSIPVADPANLLSGATGDRIVATTPGGAGVLLSPADARTLLLVPSFPVTAPDDVIDGGTASAFFVTNEVGAGRLYTAAQARLHIGGAVTTDFTVGSSGWTLSAGSSGRGSAVQSGAGLTLDLTSGALVAWDSGSGFNAPSATRTLPAGGARGCRAEIAFSAPSNVDNRTGLFFRDASRNYTVGVQYNRSSNLIELIGLSPGIAVFGSTTLASTRALCVEIVGGQLAAYAATTATPGETDWRFVGATVLPTSTRARGLDTVEIAHPTYAAVASTVVIASATVRAL